MGVCVAVGTRVLVGTKVGKVLWLVGVAAGKTGLKGIGVGLETPVGTAAWEGLQAVKMRVKKEAKRINLFLCDFGCF